MTLSFHPRGFVTDLFTLSLSLSLCVCVCVCLTTESGRRVRVSSPAGVEVGVLKSRRKIFTERHTLRVHGDGRYREREERDDGGGWRFVGNFGRAE